MKLLSNSLSAVDKKKLNIKGWLFDCPIIH